MSRIVLKLCYRGTHYKGWQVQSNAVSVQSTVQDAIEYIFGTRYGITGCSRTDSGVHANEFICHLDSEAVFGEIQRLPLALNTKLPKDIAVLDAFYANDDFHSRYSAKGKEYQYIIHNSCIRNPFLNGFAFRYFPLLDVDELNEKALALVGEHDFTAFAGKKVNIEDTIRNIWYCKAVRDGDIIRINIAADGFLYNMVRIIVGTLLWDLAGRLKYEIPAIIDSKDRKNAGMTAPAHGLYLNKVFYS
ncbi:MAG: tRNA pseudouridine(38-40) synthase TruA [Clostridiales bacterium GWF2_38_85]|nr:MAG: tRNA pseudouridine(38-40) synthase TruA [Clostridiales bacterium GWF2_38_85]HBL83512.1 tRNA pseudouridine(38-40) synthase TruA [Clostridiales bacterium]